MYFKVSYDQEFDDLYMHLKSKYPAQLFDLDGIGKQLDMHQFAKSFYGMDKVAADVSIDANANVAGKDCITYNFEMPKPFHKLNSYFLLWKKLRELYGLEKANAIIEMQLTGDIYINDFWDIGRPYCFNFSTYDIALCGLPMGDRVKPVPPKSLYSFVRQVEQFTVYAANSTLGATGLADLLIVMAWYVDRMGDPYREKQGEPHYSFNNGTDADDYVREVLSSLVYTLNWQFRGNQSPFTNISLYDAEFLKELVPAYLINGVAPQIATVMHLQREFMSIMNQELSRSPLTFPVTTACFAVDEQGTILDEAFLAEVSQANLKFGFINIYCGKSSTLSSCCRLRSDSKSEYFNSFGAGSTKIGSLGVVTINLPRAAYTAMDMDANGFGDAGENFTDLVDKLVEAAACVNHAKRMIIQRRVERGNLPLYTLGHMDLKRQYSTCGIIGLYEAMEIIGDDLAKYQDRAISLLLHINSENERNAEQYHFPHNVEQVPAENSSICLTNKDRLMGIDLGVPYYSNQFLPLTKNVSMLKRIHVQGLLDKHFSGGAICHVNVDERLEDATKLADLIRYCAKQGVVYWAVNYALGLCPKHGMTVVKHEGTEALCPTCGEKMETFTRVVGFLTNTKNWHKVRRENDWPNRQFYNGLEE